MKNSFLLFAISSVLLVPSASGRAHVTYQSECGPEPRHLTQAKVQLSPWFADLKTKLKMQPHYDQLVAEILKDKDIGDSVVCFFGVSERGDIQNLKVVQPRFEKMIADLLRNSAPLGIPPNKLPSTTESGIKLEFRKTDQNVDLVLGLGVCNTRIGQ